MPRKQKKSKAIPHHNVPLPIDEYPVDVKVAPEVITESQPLATKEKQGKQGYVDGVHVGSKNLIPLQPGQSGNPSGRPKDIVKEIGKRIASSKVDKALGEKSRKLAEDMGFDPRDMTLLENIMLQLATSKNPMKIELFLKRTFGNVPNININAEVDAQLVARFRAKFTDSELEAIADGASPMDILFEKLPDIDSNDYSNIIEAETTNMDEDDK